MARSAAARTCASVEWSTSLCCPQVVLGASLGIMRPSAVTWLDSNLFTYALGFLMLSMGLTLTVDDFKKVGLSNGTGRGLMHATGKTAAG